MKITSKIKKHLSKDPILKPLVKDLKPLDLAGSMDLFNELTKSIAYQQISYKAADKIYERFVDLLGREDYLPSDVMLFSAEEIKKAGFSRPKSQYILNIAVFFEEKELYGNDWSELTDQEIIKLLTEIKGVGEWTVHMILMFQLLRPDVFPSKDYGIQMAMKSLYDIKEEKAAMIKKMERIASHWSPYRSYASKYLWNWKRDNP